MFNFRDRHKKLLKQDARPIFHMRSQLEHQRFGLVFGSGLSKAFHLPIWSELVEKIAEDPQVDGKDLLDKFSETKSLPYQTELLLQHFKRKKEGETGFKDLSPRAFEYRTLAEWLIIVAKHLYSNTPADFRAEVVEHPYLKAYLPIIRQTPMTVTYNFDNYIERALEYTKQEDDEILSRGFETITNPLTQFRRRNAIIYHPNGFFPPELMELPVDKFVFSEASYAEQFAEVLSGDHSALINHFSKNTCLLIGLSLEDEMLRNILILSSVATPGNYHYYAYYLQDENELNSQQREAIKRTNFNIYNLITLFLLEEDIVALGELINSNKVSEADICDCSQEIGVDHAYRFYVTGPMGVGKSTTLNNFRNLNVFDEWLEERPEILAKPWDELDKEESEFADNWIINQFYKKNKNLKHRKSGVFLVDRPPLDPLSFTPPDNQKDKAQRLLSTICPGSAPWKVENGTIILLTGDPKELAVRMLLTRRLGYTAEKLEKMEKAMKEVYSGDGCVIIDTFGLTISEVTKRVAEIIHLSKYEPYDLHERLVNFQEGKITVAT